MDININIDPHACIALSLMAVFCIVTLMLAKKSSR